MQSKESLFHTGFTLIEILVGLLLLAIVAIGSFKTFHFSHSSSNSNLLEFQRLQIQQQLSSLQELKQTYPNINADSNYDFLSCLIDHQDGCELIP